MGDFTDTYRRGWEAGYKAGRRDALKAVEGAMDLSPHKLALVQASCERDRADELEHQRDWFKSRVATLDDTPVPAPIRPGTFL